MRRPWVCFPHATPTCSGNHPSGLLGGIRERSVSVGRARSRSHHPRKDQTSRYDSNQRTRTRPDGKDAPYPRGWQSWKTGPDPVDEVAWPAKEVGRLRVEGKHYIADGDVMEFRFSV